jgi:hypothetical protein
MSNRRAPKEPHREAAAIVDVEIAMTNFERSMLQANLRAMIAADQDHKAQMRAARARCRNDPALVACLLEQAQRRGQREIDWAEYFRNTDISDGMWADADYEAEAERRAQAAMR